ncbi:tail protein X [Aeromonas aquatica]|uniref:tail protein X n=1 Tax=Aeromonas aquatica TaxID=558964 RepID=UPI00068B1941|nr:tail protein X [Aeromonas aquatica]
MSNATLTMVYTTKQGDMLDAIVDEHYNRDPQALALVLNANPGLAKLAVRLPMDLEITLPPLPVRQRQTITIWG